MRIAYDVTPLSHPRTGVGNYILGALKGMVEAADGSHELVAFGPVSVRGRSLLDATLADLPIERRIRTVPFGHAVRTAWSRLGRPSAERFLGHVDVLHFTDWMVPPGRPRVRATMIHDLGPLRYPERLHPRTVRMHSATARAAIGCDVVFTNAEYTAKDIVEQLGIARERIRVAYPGVDARYKRNWPNDLFIVPLAGALAQARETDKAIRQARGERAETSEAILVADASTPYRLLIEVMYTLGQSEFGREHLLVVGGRKR